MSVPAPSWLVTPAELAGLLGSKTGRPLVVLDVRYPGPASTTDGYAQYLQGHVPGAVYLSLDAALAAPHVPGVTGRHPMPSPEVLEAALVEAGVSQTSHVIVYDDWMSVAAARAWWLLRWAGHHEVRVLDGGWGAWRASGGPVETGEVAPAPGDITVRPGGRTVVDADGAARLASEGILLDARAAGRFRGEGETIDPVAGHVPGAQNLPAMDLVDDAGFFLPVEQLAESFARLGVQAGVAAGVYCGSGIQACHVALAAAVCGADEDLAVYAGSWSEWITDARRPVARG